MQLHSRHAGERRKVKTSLIFVLLNLSAGWRERPSAPFVCGVELMRRIPPPLSYPPAPPSAGSGRLADFIARPKSMCEWNKRRTDKVHTLPCVTQPLSPGPRRTHSSAHAGCSPNPPAVARAVPFMAHVCVFVFLFLHRAWNSFGFSHNLAAADLRCFGSAPLFDA